MDQGLFATSNFALNILLARWLTPLEYGAFGLAFAVFLLVGAVHQAALLEPMLVFGPGKYRERLSEYLGALIYGHFALVAVGSLALLAAGLAFALWGSPEIATVMLALAITEPFILLLWTMRRACYARVEPRLAALGGLWYILLMLGGAYFLYSSSWLSGASALGVMALSSLTVSLWLAARLRIQWPSRAGGLIGDSFREHWRYGRWSVPNSALNWVPQNIFYLVLPIYGGLAAGGSFRALMNLIRPVLQFAWALSNLLLPVLVQARYRGHEAFGSRVKTSLILFTLILSVYWILLGLFHQPLVSWIYSGQYAEHSALLWVLGFSLVFAGIKLVIGYSVRALERPDWLLIAYALPAVAAVTAGTGLVYLWGIVGAAFGLLLSQMVTAALVIFFYRRLRRSPDTQDKLNVPVQPETQEVR